MIKAIESVWVRALAVSLVLPGAAWAQTAQTPRRRNARRRSADRSLRRRPGRSRPTCPGTTQQDLTLEQAIQIALEKNLALQAAKMKPQIADYSLQSARAAFLPRYTASYSHQQFHDALEQRRCRASRTSRNNNQGFNGVVRSALAVARRQPDRELHEQPRRHERHQRRGSTRSSPRGCGFTYTQPILAGFKMDRRATSCERWPSSGRSPTSSCSRRSKTCGPTSGRRTGRFARRSSKSRSRGARWSSRGGRGKTARFASRSDRWPRSRPCSSNRRSPTPSRRCSTPQIRWRTAELSLKRAARVGRRGRHLQATAEPGRPCRSVSVQSVDIPAAVQTALDQRTDLVQQRRNLDINKLNSRGHQGPDAPTARPVVAASTAAVRAARASTTASSPTRAGTPAPCDSSARSTRPAGTRS